MWAQLLFTGKALWRRMINGRGRAGNLSGSGICSIELEMGSFSALKRLGLQLKRSSSKVGEHVAGALIVASLVAPPSPPTAVEMMYVCTVRLSIIGSLQTLEQEAMTELTMPKHANDEVQCRVSAARQMCLAASGANPGPPDGVAGQDTRAAEDWFSQKYRVAVNWG